MTILREKSVLLSLKKNSPSSFPFPLFLRSFWTKKKFEIRAKREEIRFLAFSLLVLSSRIALKSLSSSHRFFFFRGLSKGRGGGVPRETFKARARYNDDEERERERERDDLREPLFFFKSAKCFLSPNVLKPPSKQDQKSKEKRNVPMRTTRRWWPQWRPPWRAFPTRWTLGRPSCWPNCCFDDKRGEY